MKSAQSLSEYAVMIGVVTAVVLASQGIVSKALMGKIKQGSDTMVKHSEGFKSEFYDGGAVSSTGVPNPDTEWSDNTITNTESSIKNKTGKNFSSDSETETTTKSSRVQEQK